MEPVTFGQWLTRHRKRRSPLGDLARDAASDRTWPATATDRQTYLSYLIHHNACDGCIDAFKRAWITYRAAMRREGRAL